MSSTIKDTLDIIKELQYFAPWEDVLVGEKAVQYWKKLLSRNCNKHMCKEIGEYFYAQDIPFVILTEYIDEFFRQNHDQYKEKYDIKNGVAEAYLAKKLTDNSNQIQGDLDKKFLGQLDKKRDLINAHLIWMQSFISKIEGKEASLELDPTCCTVGKWLLTHKGDPEFEAIDKEHKNLHALANSAIRMYEKHEYAYFLLPYLDIMNYSYSIRDMLMNFYFVEHLGSVYVDPLTGLSNYLQLFNYIEMHNDSMSLFVFNINEFSKINLMYGHKKGNEVLKDIAECLQDVQGVQSAYRIYADVFAVVVETTERKSIIIYLKALIESWVFKVNENQIGLTIYGSVGILSKDVLELCEYGLIASQEQYGFIVEADKMDTYQIENYAKNITFKQKLHLAFMDNRIILYFQPILNIKINEVLKYEVLMRIEDDNGDILTPHDFLATLKKMYIYPEVTKVVIQKSFEYFADKPYQFSINLSYADIVNDETKMFIATMLKNNPKVAKRCIFELLESDAVINLQEVKDFFQLLHNYGVEIAIDDFGVGYSNFDMIFNLDIDYIKIDGSLIQNIENDKKSRIMLESIATIAKEKNAKVIAEWVSDKKLFDIVSTLGIDYAQGFYIGKPHDTLDIIRLEKG